MGRILKDSVLEEPNDDEMILNVEFLAPYSLVYELDRIARDRYCSRAEVIRGSCRAIIYSEAEKRKQRAALH